MVFRVADPSMLDQVKEATRSNSMLKKMNGALTVIKIEGENHELHRSLYTLPHI